MDDKMYNLIEKRNIVHIVSELIALIGITFYFNQKNKKMMVHIEDLSQRLEEQEDLINKHERIINQLVEFIKKEKNNNQCTPNKSKQNNSKKSTIKPSSSRHLHKSNKNMVENINQETFGPDVMLEKYNITNLSSESDNESDLDGEIREELEELEEKEELEDKKEELEEEKRS